MKSGNSKGAAWHSAQSVRPCSTSVAKRGGALASDLQDFCAAHYNCPAVEVIREAVRQFIDARLEAEPEMCRRFEKARKDRLKTRQA